LFEWWFFLTALASTFIVLLFFSLLVVLQLALLAFYCGQSAIGCILMLSWNIVGIDPFATRRLPSPTSLCSPLLSSPLSFLSWISWSLLLRWILEVCLMEWLLVSCFNWSELFPLYDYILSPLLYLLLSMIQLSQCVFSLFLFVRESFCLMTTVPWWFILVLLTLSFNWAPLLIPRPSHCQQGSIWWELGKLLSWWAFSKELYGASVWLVKACLSYSCSSLYGRSWIIVFFLCFDLCCSLFPTWLFLLLLLLLHLLLALSPLSLFVVFDTFDNQLV